MYHVITLPSAEQDFLRIFNYISDELFNIEAAMSLLDEFEKAKVKLSTHPTSYTIHETVGRFDFRKKIINNYLIFFNINEETKTVYISLVAHELQDYDILLAQI